MPAVNEPTFPGHIRKLITHTLYMGYSRRGTFEKMLMPAVNEPTFPGHIRKLITPCTWATHVEVMAAATYFQVPVYECCLDPSQNKDGNALHHRDLLPI